MSRRIGRRAMLMTAGAALAGAALPRSPARAQPSLQTLEPVATFGDAFPGWALSSIFTLALSGDGKAMLTSASFGYVATLWDLTTKEEVKSLKSEDIVATNFVGDGQRAIIASSKNKIELWDLANERIIRTIAPEGARIETAAKAPNDRHLAVGQDRMLSLWDLESCARLAVRDDPDLGLFLRIAFAPDGKRLACPYFGSVRLYDVPSLQLLVEWPVGLDSGGVAFTPDGARILFGDSDGIRILDVAGKKEAGRIGPPGPQPSFFSGIATFGNGRLFAATDDYGHFLIGSLARLGFIAKSPDPQLKASRVAISRDQKYAYVGTVEGQVVAFDVSGLS
jgi:WD40 repeat protein